MLKPLSTTSQVIADFTTTSRTSGCGSLVVEFLDASLGSPNTWHWDFGNGITSNMKNPIAFYNTSGNYNVSLTVSDSLFNDTKVEYSFIIVYRNPEFDFFSDYYEGCQPLSVNFLDSTTSVLDSFYWDFGDGASSSLRSPNHVYNDTGYFTVSLIVIDSNNCQSLIVYDDLIEVFDKPITNFSSDIILSCDSIATVSFMSHSLGADLFIWDFGDGAMSNIENPTHTFNTGLFSITLFTKNATCSDTLIMFDLINVLGVSYPSFIADTTQGCEGVNIQFDNLTLFDSSSIFLWDFGDGGISNIRDPEYIFSNAGSYNINLKHILDQCTTNLIYPIEINIYKKPIIYFTSDTSYLCELPYNVNFLDSTINASEWLWDFGDGNISSIKDPSNYYTDTGYFNIALSVTSDEGCVNSDTFFNYIQIDTSSYINFSSNYLTLCVGQDVSFFNLSNRQINNWYWYFGDGDTSNNIEPTHSYSMIGIYDVTLIGGNNYCKDSLVFYDYIKVIEPRANFDDIHDCSNLLKVEFVNYSLMADSVFWDFGDGRTSNLLNPIHTFPDTGIYSVSLSVTNFNTGCTHELVKNIRITYPKADFNYLINSHNSYRDSVGCIPHQVYIENNSQNFDYFYVDWGNDSIVANRLDYTFLDTGFFNVTMVVFDVNGCSDTLTVKKMFHMYNNLSVDFNVSNVLGCDSMLVQFENNANHPISNLRWYFGDNSTSSINNPEHIYYDEGYYDVTLVAKSVYGCVDTARYLDYVIFKKPMAFFESNIQQTCIGDQIYFTNLSIGHEITSNWYFGDGSGSNLVHPNHVFSANGSYEISLIVTDSLGCSSDLVVSNYIKVLSPQADFSTQLFSSDCPPLVSNFINLSSHDVTSFVWNFGDGEGSYFSDPSHLFSDAGYFDISLVVSNNYGCKDTIIKPNLINVLGPSGSFLISDTLICAGESVDFLLDIHDASSFIWDFGDGTYSLDSFPRKRYNYSSSFLPTLVLEDSLGCQVSINSNDSIVVRSFDVDAGEDYNLCLGESFELNASGDGHTFIWSSLNNIALADTSFVTVEPLSNMMYYVYNTDGFCSDIDSIFLFVDTNIPNPSFITENHCVDELTYFMASSGLSTNNVYYSWSFGGNTIIDTAQLSLGVNAISLIVLNLDNDCSDTISQNVDIYPLPIADFSTNDVCLGEEVFFYDSSSSNVVSWIYDFNDGTSNSFSNNTSHLYSTPGLYQPSLNVFSDMGCSNYIQIDLRVNSLPDVDFICYNNCEDEVIKFSDITLLEEDSISSYLFDFGDSNYAYDSVVFHQFSHAGIYNVNLTVASSQGCSSSLDKLIEIYKLPSISFNYEGVCLGDTTLFYSSIYSDNQIKAWHWDFGDKVGYSNIEETSYRYNNLGYFLVTLSAESNEGCFNYYSDSIKIYDNPQANFSVVNFVCAGEEVQFNNHSLGHGDSIINWHWSMGDGVNLYSQEPTYVYVNPNYYDVSLSIISEFGCKHDTIINSAIQVVESPVASFGVSSFEVSEINSEISFYNYSQSYKNIEWYFGNGYVSNEINPIIKFNDIGEYNIVLIASNDFGCESKEIKSINVLPQYTVYIPNSFSPNRDGYNDTFNVKGQRILDFNMKIYDRWGGVLFQTNNIEEGWDGYDSKGNIYDSGSYLYHISLLDNHGKAWVYNGEFMLFR